MVHPCYSTSIHWRERLEIGWATHVAAERRILQQQLQQAADFLPVDIRTLLDDASVRICQVYERQIQLLEEKRQALVDRFNQRPPRNWFNCDDPQRFYKDAIANGFCPLPSAVAIPMREVLQVNPNTPRQTLVDVAHERRPWRRYNALCFHLSITIAAATFDVARFEVQHPSTAAERMLYECGITNDDLEFQRRRRHAQSLLPLVPNPAFHPRYEQQAAAIQLLETDMLIDFPESTTTTVEGQNMAYS